MVVTSNLENNLGLIFFHDAKVLDCFIREPQVVGGILSVVLVSSSSIDMCHDHKLSGSCVLKILLKPSNSIVFLRANLSRILIDAVLHRVVT